MIESTPKSHNARVIDLDAETITKLRYHRCLQQEVRNEWGTDYRDRDLVVVKENGEPIHPQTISQSFGRILRRAGLRTIRLHDLRHTHASLALMASVPSKVISERQARIARVHAAAIRARDPWCRLRRQPRSPTSSARVGPERIRNSSSKLSRVLCPSTPCERLPGVDGPKIIARSISAGRIPDSYDNVWQYHSRSDRHSKVACWTIAFELMQACELLREHVASGKVVLGVNHTLRDFQTQRKKDLDLVIAQPAGTDP